MSIGTFMDSLLCSVQCGFSNTIGDAMNHVLDPITPECVWEKRRARAEKSFDELQAMRTTIDWESEVKKREKEHIEKGTPYVKPPEWLIAELKSNSSKEEKEIKGELVVSVPDVEDSKTEKANPVKNVDDILQKIAAAANNENAKNELLEQITKDVNLQAQLAKIILRGIPDEVKSMLNDDSISEEKKILIFCEALKRTKRPKVEYPQE